MKSSILKSLVFSFVFLMAISPVEAWKETHTIKGQTFEIDFPQQPTLDERTDRKNPFTKLSAPFSLVLDPFTLSKSWGEFFSDTEYTYLLSLFVLPPSIKIDPSLALQEILTAAREEPMGYVVIEEKIYKQNGLDVLDLTIFYEKEKKTETTRIMIRENHFYILTVADNGRKTNPTEFFDSFKIHETATN